jgi:hypothetical protein
MVEKDAIRSFVIHIKTIFEAIVEDEIEEFIQGCG